MHVIALAALVIYGNVAASTAASAVTPGPIGVLFGLSLCVAVLIIARRTGVLSELGLRRERLHLDALAGSAIALVAVVGAVVLLRIAPFVGGPVTYAPLATMAAGDLAFRVAVTMPLDTVIPEELAFRGLVLAHLRRRWATAAAVAISAGAFTLWHVVVVFATVAETRLAADPVLAALGVTGALLAVFGGGVLFAILRVRTGGLAAPVAAHWTFNTALLVGLAALGE